MSQGEWLRARLEVLGLEKQADAVEYLRARGIKIGGSTLSMYLSNDRAIGRVRLEAICDALDAHGVDRAEARDLAAELSAELSVVS